MLILKRPTTAAEIGAAETQIPLGGNAFLWIRPAETFEHIEAAQSALLMLVAVSQGDAAARALYGALGRRFEDGEFEGEYAREAAAQMITTLELATLCATSWKNVGDEDGNPITTDKPSREHLALLLRDVEVFNRVSAALKKRINEEWAEGNGSATSPSGAVAIPVTAPTAAPSTSPAQEAVDPRKEIAAPN